MPNLALILSSVLGGQAIAATQTPGALPPPPEAPVEVAPPSDTPPSEPPATGTPSEPPVTDPPGEPPATDPPGEPPVADPPAAPTESPDATPPTAPTTRPPESRSPPPNTTTPVPQRPSARPTTPPPAAPAPAPTPPASAPPPAPESSEKKPAPDGPKDAGEKKPRLKHGGFIVDAQVGATACGRAVCQGASGHHATPGLHLGAFVGANLFGLLELGIEGGWNTLRPHDVAGRNAMALYGLDPAMLQQALAAEKGLPLPSIDFTGLDVASATSRAFDIGPSVRIHFLRKGRGLLFVGAGVHYQLWRNRYATPSGAFRLDFHGASIPLRVGGGAFIHKNIALMGELTYAPAVYGIVGIHLPDTATAAPLKVIDEVAKSSGPSLSSRLPHFWGFALTLRFRL